jgi:tRNA(Ile)-lysidine synthetase-like protein
MLKYPMNFIKQIMSKMDKQATIALSMGCDSLSIAHFIRTKYPTFKLSAFHYNHKLRPQNDTMSKMAQTFCNTFNIPIKIIERDTVEFPDISESGLRTARYTAAYGMGNLITGHHLDDCVENFLYNCFNGVPEYNPIPLINDYVNKNLTVYRPFVLTEKRALREYVQQHDLQMFLVEDETNVDNTARRNWLRNVIIPEVNGKGYNLHTIVKKKILTNLNK